MKNMNYVLSKETNSFGDYIVKFWVNGEIRTVVYEEGNWPDALQIHNELRHLSGELIGE